MGVFRVDEASGVLTVLAWEPTRGTTPRFIGLDPGGTRLYAANQRSDTIVEFSVDEATGLLTATAKW